MIGYVTINGKEELCFISTARICPETSPKPPMTLKEIIAMYYDIEKEYDELPEWMKKFRQEAIEPLEQRVKEQANG